MKSQLVYGSLFLLANAAAWGQGLSGSTAAPCAPNSVDEAQQKGLLQEVRKLRIELLEVRMEAQNVKVLNLEQGLTQIEVQRSRLLEEERAAPQQLANLDPRYQGQTLLPEQRAELEILKATFMATQTEHLNTERSALQAREAETSAALQLEQQRLQALKAKLNELTAAP